MEIIQKVEAEDILFHTKGKESAMSTWIKKLEVGEMLRISKADWNQKHAPYKVANYIAKKSTRKFKCGKQPGFDGWVILRIG